MLSKVEIDILNHLYTSGLIDPMNSRTISNISKHIGLNHSRIRNNINHLHSLQMVNLGYKERQSNAYFISQKGIDEIESKT